MKKLFLLFGVALFVVTGCQEQQQQDKNVAQVVMHKQHFENDTKTPINGERDYYKSGDLHKKVTFVEGYPETIISYYPDQQKRTKVVIADAGEGEVMEHIEWYKSGQKKFESVSQIVKEWHKNGQLKSETHYDEDGNLHGIAKMWNEEGALQGQEKYEHGELVESSKS